MKAEFAPSELEKVQFNDQGLIPAIAQDGESGDVLMMAWMNKEALTETLTSGFAVYYSRSRAQLWRKGESSGNTQRVLEVRLDCDADAVLLCVEQAGGVACHTGRKSCFFNVYTEGRWVAEDNVLRDPQEMYNLPPSR